MIPDFLKDVQFTELPQPEATDGLPFATHEGVFEFCGFRLRCYRLSDGRAIFNADDFAAFVEEWGLE